MGASAQLEVLVTSGLECVLCSFGFIVELAHRPPRVAMVIGLPCQARAPVGVTIAIRRQWQDMSLSGVYPRYRWSFHVWVAVEAHPRTRDGGGGGSGSGGCGEGGGGEGGEGARICSN
jgi:uncharacterized membrane protein YgcG